MHPAEIKAHLEMADSSMSLLARALGVTPQAVRAVVHGVTRSRRIEESISKLTGVPLSELWPRWHGVSARPSKRPSPAESRRRERELIAQLSRTDLPTQRAA
jgi:lambda repressor-like predicted transcriptional regulator